MSRQIAPSAALRDRVLAGVHVAIARRTVRPIRDDATPLEWLAIAAAVAVVIATVGAMIESVPAIARVPEAAAGCTLTARARRAGVPIEHVASSPDASAGFPAAAAIAREPFTLRPRDRRQLLEETF
jgi:hypothetical protein